MKCEYLNHGLCSICLHPVCPTELILTTTSYTKPSVLNPSPFKCLGRQMVVLETWPAEMHFMHGVYKGMLYIQRYENLLVEESSISLV
jgi:hypothetical protein